MPDHLNEWLGAYHDGQLHGARLRQVEAHLAVCAQCQAGLDEIRRLSQLLQADAAQTDYLSSERFAANLALRLPRRSAAPQPRRGLHPLWWFVPVGLLGTWLFLNITLSLSSVVQLALDRGLLGSSLLVAQAGAPQMEWFAFTRTLFGSQLAAPADQVLQAANQANLFLLQLASWLLPQLFLALAYLGWLLAWWLRQQSVPSPEN